MNATSAYEIRARYDDTSIRVYQAYSAEIAEPSIKAGHFVSPFKLDRMTWIKPSFNWMMHRSGFGSKVGQTYILAIDLERKRFDQALEIGVLTSFHSEIYRSHEEWRYELGQSPVRIQWDPERDWRSNVIRDRRTIQVGLAGEAIRQYASDWILKISDVTPVAAAMRFAKENGNVPLERPDILERSYPVSAEAAARIVPAPSNLSDQ